MRRVHLIPALVLFTAVSAHCEQLSWNTKTVTLTLVEGQQGAEAEFEYRNTSDRLVEINNISTSCTCTVAGDYVRFIAPGRAGKLKMYYRPGDRTGDFRQTTTVVSGVDKTELVIQGATLEWTAITPRTLVWRQDSNEDFQTVKVSIADGVETTLLPIKSDALDIEAIRTSHDLYTLKIRPKEPHRRQTITLPIQIMRQNPEVVVVRNAFIVVR
jgi:hypothetical protein